MEKIIDIKGVSKIYKTGEKEFKALDNIDLSINDIDDDNDNYFDDFYD